MQPCHPLGQATAANSGVRRWGWEGATGRAASGWSGDRPPQGPCQLLTLAIRTCTAAGGIQAGHGSNWHNWKSHSACRHHQGGEACAGGCQHSLLCCGRPGLSLSEKPSHQWTSIGRLEWILSSFNAVLNFEPSTQVLQYSPHQLPHQHLAHRLCPFSPKLFQGPRPAWWRIFTAGAFWGRGPVEVEEHREVEWAWSGRVH